MVVRIIRLWPLQCLEDLRPHQTEPRLLGSMVQLNKSVLNLHSSTKLKQLYYKHPLIIHPLKYVTKSPKMFIKYTTPGSCILIAALVRDRAYLVSPFQNVTLSVLEAAVESQELLYANSVH